MPRLAISNGPLSLGQIRRIGAKLAALARTQQERDAALFAQRNPHAILARPELQEKLIRVANSLGAESGPRCTHCGHMANLRIGEGLSHGLCERCEQDA